MISESWANLLYKLWTKKLDKNWTWITENVIDWFKTKFVIFDIKKFPLSFKEYLLKQSLDFYDNYIKVSNEDKAIIKHTRKIFLLNDQQTQVKKETDLLHVAMGA